MSSKVEAVAVVLLLAGFLLFATMETALIGALLVAGGTYALLIPRLVTPGGPPSAR